MRVLQTAVLASAAAVLLLGGVIAGTQWLLTRIDGDSVDPEGSAPYTQTKEKPPCHQPR